MNSCVVELYTLYGRNLELYNGESASEFQTEKTPTKCYFLKMRLKVKTSFGNAPLSKNEMEALITNHVKEYVLTNT